MKKCFVLILSLFLIFVALTLPAQAASYSENDNFYLSTKNKSASGKTFSYNKNNINVTTYVQHWKGNASHADTARSQIKSGSNISQTSCCVDIYVNGKLNTSNTDPTYAETATGLWAKVQRTHHKISLSGSTGNTLTYVADGSSKDDAKILILTDYD